MTMHVSVVIPTRDRPQLLRRAIRSVLAQTADAAIEILVVFDGSPIEDLSDVAPGRHRIRTMANSRTRGLAGARNTGIAAAASPLIAFCDDDDEWLAGKLAAQLPLLDDPRVPLVATGIRVLTTRGAHDRPSPARATHDDLLRSRITELHPSSFLFRAADAHGRLGLIDEELPASYGEDYDLLLRAAELGDIVAVPTPLTLVHWDRSSYFTDRWRGVADGLGYLLDKHAGFASAPLGRARVEGQIAFAHGALGEFRSARTWATRALRDDRHQLRAYLALIVGLRILSGRRVISALNARGRGV